MNIRARLRRFICPSCLPIEPVERHPAIGVLERSADALDRMVDEVRRIREEMADGPNPFLGDAPGKPKRRGEQSR